MVVFACSERTGRDEVEVVVVDEVDGKKERLSYVKATLGEILSINYTNRCRHQVEIMNDKSPEYVIDGKLSSKKKKESSKSTPTFM